MILFKPRINKVIFAQITGGLCVIIPLKNKKIKKKNLLRRLVKNLYISKLVIKKPNPNLYDIYRFKNDSTSVETQN